MCCHLEILRSGERLRRASQHKGPLPAPHRLPPLRDDIASAHWLEGKLREGARSIGTKNLRGRPQAVPQRDGKTNFGHESSLWARGQVDLV